MNPDADQGNTRPCSTSVPVVNDFELPAEGFAGAPEEVERQSFEKVCRDRGDFMLQLTWRAFLTGSVLGGVVVADQPLHRAEGRLGCILSHAIWTTLYQIGRAKTPMTILENNCMQSTASLAGYSTGGTPVSAFSACIKQTFGG